MTLGWDKKRIGLNESILQLIIFLLLKVMLHQSNNENNIQLNTMANI